MSETLVEGTPITIKGVDSQPPASTWREGQEARAKAQRRTDQRSLMGRVAMTVAAALALVGGAKAREAVTSATTEAPTVGPTSSHQEVPGQPSEKLYQEFVREESRGRTYTVKERDTMTAIARGAYPDFNDNQPYFKKILRQANYQDPRGNLNIFPGERLYIPDPDPQRSAYGLAPGEEVFGVGFKGINEVGGEKLFRLTFAGWEPENKGMKIGDEFVASSEGGEQRSYKLVAYLPEMPHYDVPERIVFEQAAVPSE